MVQCSISDSPVWKDMMKVRHIYLKGREFKLGNGKLVSFWLDVWIGDEPLCKQYPILYELCLDQNSSVFDVANNEWVLQFKVRLPPIIREQWYDLAMKLNNVTLERGNDKVVWKWSAVRNLL
jgi:hypothetical protein